MVLLIKPVKVGHRSSLYRLLFSSSKVSWMPVRRRDGMRRRGGRKKETRKIILENLNCFVQTPRPIQKK